jgi:hypothetical protein
VITGVHHHSLLYTVVFSSLEPGAGQYPGSKESTFMQSTQCFFSQKHSSGASYKDNSDFLPCESSYKINVSATVF